jgi:hypothetical protein
MTHEARVRAAAKARPFPPCDDCGRVTTADGHRCPSPVVVR